MIRTICVVLSIVSIDVTMAQEIPYEEIPAAPESYTAENVAARMVDGLGYRYYWATEGLTAPDLAYSPSADARTARETIDHLYGLSETILNSTLATPNIRPADWSDMSFEEMRNATLRNLQEASQNMKSDEPGAMNEYKVIFQRGASSNEFPFWNMLNGPIADALYHTGQIVSFRRSSGNPMNPKVSVFMGKNRN